MIPMMAEDHTDSSFMVVGPQRRGRPRAQERGTTLSTWLPESQYDQLVRLANRREQSVSSLVRDLLKFKLK
jgi:hypothetical protein